MPTSSGSSASPPRPLAPIDGVRADGPRPTFRWEPAPDATGYHLQVALRADFEQPLLDTVVPPTTAYRLDQPLSPRTATSSLFWRVRAERSDGPTAWSAAQPFALTRDDAVAVPVRDGHTSTRMALLWITLMIVSFAATIGLLYWAGMQIS